MFICSFMNLFLHTTYNCETIHSFVQAYMYALWQWYDENDKHCDFKNQSITGVYKLKHDTQALAHNIAFRKVAAYQLSITHLTIWNKSCTWDRYLTIAWIHWPDTLEHITITSDLYNIQYRWAHWPGFAFVTSRMLLIDSVNSPATLLFTSLIYQQQGPSLGKIKNTRNTHMERFCPGI